MENLNKIIELISIFCCLLVNQVYCQQSTSCHEMRVRRNIRSLNSSEWSEYVDVFREMYRRGEYDNLAAIHVANFRTIHDYPQFLVWHRYFVWDFENRMRAINPHLTLPYWDAAADFEAPHQSLVFSPRFFGGNGSPHYGYCVTDGFLASIQSHYPYTHCIRRDFRGHYPDTIAAWHSPAFITSLIQTTSGYDQFRQNLEHSLHNSIHFGIGGAWGDFSKEFSPVDALFYLHHANIDRIYFKWQISNPANLDAMDGYQLTKRGRLVPINHGYLLDYYRVPIGDALRTMEEPLCYTYDDASESRGVFTNFVESQLNKLPKRILRRYFPKFFDGSESDFDHDFIDSRNVAFSKPLPHPMSLPKEWFERMGFNVSRGLSIQTKAQKFIHDMNMGMFKKDSPLFSFPSEEAIVDEDLISQENLTKGES